ncbi:hypothetical protein G7054_g6259 [Neopestalotiopsis clavispora]|nr:hypothetical protein G7054_g6259 [Neopestalotiopsis clavispora]
MWLINTETFSLVFHHECPEDQYAILSHTWEEDEVSFQDFKHLTSARLKKGFSKIDSTLRKARNYGYKWAWVDTCCIDKSSSAELSEAINSMYRWYEQSAICLAFLSDLPTSSEPQPNAFKQCRWWTRGWTLQELIAPRHLHFYDQDWNKYGSRSELLEEIESITGISSEAYQRSPNAFSVAQRMSWASHRTTTRTEDIAYCLLGLFNVNMPLIYGEGDNAFIRLQEEICKTYPDLTAFAWTTQPSLRAYSPAQKFRGLLASHPAEFAGCGRVRPVLRTQQWNYNQKNTTIGNWDIGFDGMTLQMDEVYGLLMYVGWTRTTTLEDVRLYISLTRTIDGYVRSLPDRLAGDFERSSSSPSVGEFNEKFLKLFMINLSVHPGMLITPSPKVSCLKHVSCKASIDIASLHEEALLIDVDPTMHITAAYPEAFWVPNTKVFMSSSNRKHDRWDEDDEFERISEMIKEEKLTTYAGYLNLRKALQTGNWGGWDPEHEKIYPSTWEFRENRASMQADLDPEQWDSGKTAIRLRTLGR